MLESLHIGVDVYGTDGHRLGTLQRVVIDTEEHRVEAIVVEEGLIESGNVLAPGGWDKPRGRLVPASMITTSDDRRVTVACDEKTFDTLPHFEQEHALPLTEEATLGHPRFHVGELIRYISSSAAGLGGAPYLPPESITFTKSPEDVQIPEDAPVWRKEPHEDVGEVERVLLDDASGRVAALVMRRKGLRGQRVRLPMSSIADIQDGVVHVTLTDDELNALEPYAPED